MFDQPNFLEAAPAASGVPETQQLIVIRQLPIIDEQLRQIKDSVQKRVGEVLALACTEQTRADVKRARADLRKEFEELEERRKYVKQAIIAPYEQFEATYRECVADLYKKADRELADRIAGVENQLKQEKAAAIEAYFNEYRQSLGIDSSFVSFSTAKINVTLSVSIRSLMEQVRTYLDDIAGDLAVIALQEDKDEILAEYKTTLDLTSAVQTVEARHRAIENERRRREQAEADRLARENAQKKVEAVVAAAEPVAESTPEPVAAVAPPVAAPAQEPETTEQIYATVFRVTGTISQLKALKKFLTDGGYTYEQC